MPTSSGRMESAVSVQSGSSSGAFAPTPRTERRGERWTRRRNRKTKNVFSKHLTRFSISYHIRSYLHFSKWMPERSLQPDDETLVWRMAKLVQAHSGGLE